jgi:hypothetical protein
MLYCAKYKAKNILSRVCVCVSSNFSTEKVIGRHQASSKNHQNGEARQLETVTCASCTVHIIPLQEDFYCGSKYESLLRTP